METCKNLKKSAKTGLLVAASAALCLFVSVLLLSCLGRPKTAYSEKTMVCLGDSITSGYLIDHPYPERVGGILGMKEVKNYGIPGSTLTVSGGVSPFVERYTDMEDADVVAVLFAGNDATYRVPVGDPDDVGNDTVYGALNTLIRGLKEKYPSAYIFFITPLKNENSPAIAPYVEATRTACLAHGIDLLDQFDDGEYDPATDTVDGIHLTQKYIDETFAPRVADFIREHDRMLSGQ